MPDRVLVFWFDYISHNAYLAWTQLPALCARHGLRVEPRPALFGALLSAHGQLGPAEVRPKGAWMLRDVLRKAARLGIPIAPPASHPFNPLLALRATCAPMSDAERLRLVGELFEATWLRSEDVSSPAVVARAADAAGLDGAALVEQAGTEAARSALRSSTDAALAAGVFGVPSMQVGNEVFWGLDDFTSLEEHLRGEDPLRPESLTPWLAVRPSIQRRRPA